MKTYTKNQFLKAAEAGEVSMIDAEHIVSLLDEVVAADQVTDQAIQDTIETQQQLIELLFGQVIDLTMMSKIELGDDVIAEIQRLKNLIK